MILTHSHTNSCTQTKHTYQKTKQIKYTHIHRKHTYTQIDSHKTHAHRLNYKSKNKDAHTLHRLIQSLKRTVSRSQRNL